MQPSIIVTRDVRSIAVDPGTGVWTATLDCTHSTVLQEPDILNVGSQVQCPPCGQLALAAIPPAP